MIAQLHDEKQKKMTRLKLYKDFVFIITHEAVRSMKPVLPAEELFATADNLAGFMLEYELTDPECIMLEINELKEQINDNNTTFIITSLAFIKLCAIRKNNAHAEPAARALLPFCQEFDRFNELLQLANKKEMQKSAEGKHANLLAYELMNIGNDRNNIGDEEVVAAIVDSAVTLNAEGIQHVEIALAETNTRLGNIYDKELGRLRMARKRKSEQNINIERVNDIHGNSNVNIGN